MNNITLVLGNIVEGIEPSSDIVLIVGSLNARIMLCCQNCRLQVV